MHGKKEENTIASETTTMIKTNHEKDFQLLLKEKQNDDTSNHTLETEETSDSSLSFFSESADLSGSSSSLCTFQYTSEIEPLNKNLSGEIHEDFDGVDESAGGIVEVRRSIRFSDKVLCHEIVHHLNYSQEERMACWYKKSELISVRKEAQALINLLEQNVGSSELIPPGTELPTLRGLENFTKKGSEIANLYHRLAIDSVLIEQFEQDLMGIYDAKAIATRYRQVSLRCRFPARLRALQDQENVTRRKSKKDHHVPMPRPCSSSEHSSGTTRRNSHIDRVDKGSGEQENQIV